MGHLGLFRAPSVGVLDVRCRSARSGPSAERGGEPTHLALLRRGVFAYHLGPRTFVGDACTALLHRGAWSYRVSHPGRDGDDVTVFELEPGIAEELFGAAPEVAWPVTPRVQLLHHRLRAALVAGAAEVLDGEERVLDLLATLARGGGREAPAALRRRDRRIVETVKARLSAELDRNLPLTTLAAEARASPFHLMRVFRAATGLPVRAYRRRLRVLSALAALDAGRGDLARLALELGFSHHAHLTDSFRQVLGAAPSRLRRRAPAPAGGDARTFLEARPPASR